MIFEVCAIIATVVFIILAAYIIYTLILVQKSLKETALILKKSDYLVATINERVDNLKPLLDSVSDVGNSLSAVTSSFKAKKSTEDERNVQTVIDLVDLALMGFTVWKDFKRR